MSIAIDASHDQVTPDQVDSFVEEKDLKYFIVDTNVANEVEVLFRQAITDALSAQKAQVNVVVRSGDWSHNHITEPAL